MAKYVTAMEMRRRPETDCQRANVADKASAMAKQYDEKVGLIFLVRTNKKN